MNDNLGDITSDNPQSEIVLRVSLRDKLATAWGGVVKQHTGLGRHTSMGKDGYWLVFVNSGTLNVTVDGRQLDVPEGHTLLIAPDEDCRGTGVVESPIQWQWLALRVERSRKDRRDVLVEVPRICRVDEPGRVAELFRVIADEFHKYETYRGDDRPLDRPSTHHLVMSLLARLDPNRPSASEMTAEPLVLAERARDYIRLNVSKPISTAHVAAHLECSTGYLCLVFKKAFRHSPMDYLVMLRTGVAAERLRETRMSIGQIAEELSFGGPNYFARVFKSRYGMSPTAYRKANSHLYETTDI